MSSINTSGQILVLFQKGTCCRSTFGCSWRYGTTTKWTGVLRLKAHNGHKTKNALINQLLIHDTWRILTLGESGNSTPLAFIWSYKEGIKLKQEYNKQCQSQIHAVTSLMNTHTHTHTHTHTQHKVSNICNHSSDILYGQLLNKYNMSDNYWEVFTVLTITVNLTNPKSSLY